MILKCENGLTTNAQKIQYEAVSHYLRMLFLMVYLVNPDDWRKSYFCDHDGERWFADNCSYCMNFCCFDIEGDIEDDEDDVSNCPLGENSADCCGGIWKRMNRSDSAEEWTYFAKHVLNYIIEHGRDHDITKTI